MDIGWKNQGSYSFSSCKAKSHIVLLPPFSAQSPAVGAGSRDREGGKGSVVQGLKVMEGRWGGEKRWGGRGGKELKIKGRACSSTCSISAIGTSSSGSLFCLSTYVMEMTFPELLKEVDIYAASD